MLQAIAISRKSSCGALFGLPGKAWTTDLHRGWKTLVRVSRAQISEAKWQNFTEQQSKTAKSKFWIFN